MVQLNPQAQELRDRYLADVRSNLAAAGRGETGEVLRDVEEHIDRELQSLPQPVSADDLQAVLARLGKPSQWIPEEELPWWRRVLLRLRTGPEDWRLAYATFGVLMLGVFMGWIFCDTRSWGPTYVRTDNYVRTRGPSGEAVYVQERMPIAGGQDASTRHDFNYAAFAFFAAAAFLLARAAVASGPEPAQMPAGQKWLTYPVLVGVYGVLAFLIFAWPVGLGVGAYEMSYYRIGGPPWTHDYPGYYPLVGFLGFYPDPSTRAALLGIYVAALALGAWLLVLGTLLAVGRTRALLHALFHPFVSRLTRRLGLASILAGLFLLVLCALATAAAHNWNHRYF